MNRPTTSLAVANEAKRTANAERAAALTEIALDMSKPTDIIQRACHPEHRALLRITLVRLLSAEKGTSRDAARRHVTHLHDLIGVTAPDRKDIDKLTISWLVDSRSGGRRMLAFADSIDPKNQAPWPGFPYSMPNTRAAA